MTHPARPRVREWSRRPGRGPLTRLAAVLALLLVGCPKPVKEPDPDLVTGPPAVAAVPAGRVLGDTYVDGRWPLVVPIPPGWAAEVGTDAAEERVVLVDPDGDVRVTVAATPGSTVAPRPLPGCTWTFQDLARYRAVKIRDAVLAATCTPDDPVQPRVLTYVIPQEGVLFHVEGRVPQGKLRAGKVDLDGVAGAVRFR